MEFLVFFIVFDVVTGVIRALKEKNFSSEKARNGIYKKASECALLLFSYVLDGYLATQNIQVQTYSIVLTYLILMECASILENFSKNGELSGIIDTIKDILKIKSKEN